MSTLNDLHPAGGSGKSIKLVASGALSNGDRVVLQSDGTVKVIEGATQGFGSSAVFESASVSDTCTTFDSNSNKVVIAYQDVGNSYYGTVVIGTVSGTSISFGTAVVFESARANYMSISFDSNSNKVVISYHDAGNSSGYGTAIVGTVSGTSISFGTAVVFESAIIGQESNTTFDSNSNKIVIAYPDTGNSTYGTAIVGTVSGTSISFGTAAVFESATTSWMSTTFDSNSNKVVIGYKDQGNGGYLTAVVGTVSGTSISFGTPVVFFSVSANDFDTTFDSSNNKIVIAYKGDSNNGIALVGTVSGTSISFGSPVTYISTHSVYISCTFDSFANKVIIASKYHWSDDGSVIAGTVSGTSITFDTLIIVPGGGSGGTFDFSDITFDSNSNKSVIAYRDVDNSGYGTSIVFQAGYTNLTATSFIGTSEGAFSDTDTATVMLRGGITTTQSGLTIGSKYYVQTDGTLSTTAGDPSVIAGQALSATTLLIEGET